MLLTDHDNDKSVRRRCDRITGSSVTYIKGSRVTFSQEPETCSNPRVATERGCGRVSGRCCMSPSGMTKELPDVIESNLDL